MKIRVRHSIRSRLARLVLLLAFPLAGASAQGLIPNPAVTEALQRLATDDARLQRERFGDLASVAGRPWLSAVPGELASLWRDVQWIVPGAAMRFQRGFCVATKCQGTDYLVRYNSDARQLEFVEGESIQYTGRIQADGSVRLTGTGLVGVLTAETLRFDAAANVLYAEKNELRPATPAQLAAATHGFVPDPGVASTKPSSEAELRAELAAMKEKMDALSKQVEKQQQQQAPKLTPAEAREAERRAQREAKAKAAEEKRLAAEAKVREEAERRAEARARAQREAEAKAAEAKRIAEEKRAAAEAQKQAAAEAKAAEARRVADEQRARQEARKAQEAERVAKASVATTPAKAPPAPSAPAADGLYTTSSGYTLNVEFRGDTLVVKEPNKESPYRKTAPNYYEFTNPTNGIAYCMRVIDAGTLEACKPGQAPGMGTRLTAAGGGASVPSGERSRLERIARSYAHRAQSEPADAQAWSFCSLAAMSQATGGSDAQLLQAASALRSIATTSSNPCPDAIPQRAWAAAR